MSGSFALVSGSSALVSGSSALVSGSSALVRWFLCSRQGRVNFALKIFVLGPSLLSVRPHRLGKLLWKMRAL